MRFNMRIPVLLPAVAFPTHLALEGFHAQVLIHVLLQVLCLIEALITAVEWGQNTAITNVCVRQNAYVMFICKRVYREAFLCE